MSVGGGVGAVAEVGFDLRQPNDQPFAAGQTVDQAAAEGAEAKKSPSAFEFLTNPAVKKSIHKAEIKRGFPQPGDLRDKLPPIYKPKIVPIEKATFVADTDRVLGVVLGGEARAYPIFILQVHEMCNDTLGGRPIAPNY